MNVFSPANSILVICCVKKKKKRGSIGGLSPHFKQLKEVGNDHTDVTGSPQVGEVEDSLVLCYEI